METRDTDHDPCNFIFYIHDGCPLCVSDPLRPCIRVDVLSYYETIGDNLVRHSLTGTDLTTPVRVLPPLRIRETRLK